MGNPAVNLLTMSDDTFLKRVRTIAEDSKNVIITHHAKLRMKERKVLLPQVLDCLKKGTIAEPVHKSIKGDWQATLEHRCAGDNVRVAVVIIEQSSGELAIVVSVMH